MAVIAAQTIVRSGIGVTFVAANVGGDSFPNDGKTLFHVKNASGASINVTFNSVALCNFGFDHDEVQAVPAGTDKEFGPFEQARFNDPTTGQVGVTYSAVTTVTVAAKRFVPANN